jgi:chromosome segregation ATPase
MTKKRLSDVLKEEVNKADAPDSAAAEVESAPKPSRRASSARRTATSRRTKAATSKPAAEPESKSKPEPQPEPESKSKPEPQPEPDSGADEIAAQASAQADLSDRLSALEKDLAAAQKDKAQLEKTVAGLQKDLETQQGRLFELKDSLDQAETATKAKAEALTKTQAELDEAKQTILKLTEAAAPAPHRISGVDILPRRPVEPKANRPAYHRGVPDYAIQKGQPNSMLTDADIGWVD